MKTSVFVVAVLLIVTIISTSVDARVASDEARRDLGSPVYLRYTERDDEAEGGNSTADTPANDKGTEDANNGDVAKDPGEDDGSADKTNEDEVFDTFLMYCSTCIDPDYATDTADEGLVFDDAQESSGDPIFEKGYKGIWASCTDHSRTADECYVEDEHSSDIRFSFTFGKNPAFDIGNVSITSEGGDARPDLAEDVYVDADHEGRFTVRYNCKESNRRQSLVTMTMNISKTRSILVRWIKVCGRGVNDKIKLGYETDEGDRTGKTLFSEAPLVVQPHDLATKIYLSLEPPGRVQRFEPPLITSNDTKSVNVKVGGSAASGMLIYAKIGASFVVNYECLAAKSATISMEISIPPWNPLTATWIKLCANTSLVAEYKGLQVGTVKDGSDVVSQGQVQPAYAMSLNGGIVAPKVGAVVEAGTWKLRLFMSNSLGEDQGGKSVTIHKISLTVSDRNVLYVGKQMSNSFQNSNDEVVLETSGSASLELRLICMRKGEAQVIVSMATVPAGTLNFGFVKECDAPVKINESGFLLTSQSLFHIMVAMILVGVIVMVFGVRRYTANRSSNKYTAVSTSEVAARAGGPHIERT